jgi:hypothetical protein
MDEEHILMKQLKFYIAVNGKTAKKMATDFLNFLRSNIISGHLSSLLRKVMVYKSLWMETNTKASIKRVSSMEEENIFGLMDLHIKVISDKGWDMVMEVGNQHVLMLIFMLEHT